MELIIDKFLKKYTGKKIYVKPNPGNGGDALIAYALFQKLKKHNIEFEIITESADLTNKIVFFGGGGNLISKYRQCADFIRENHRIAEEIVLMPHTIENHAELLGELGNNATIICRERKSFDYINNFGNIKNKFIMDDLAFSIDPQPILNSPLRKCKIDNAIKELRIKKMKKLNFNFSTLNAFREDSERTTKAIPYDNIDVSIKYCFNYFMDDYSEVYDNTICIFQFLSNFNIINTNRLHIAIAGSLLKKEVNFFPNSYWKNEQVYEFSMNGKYKNLIFHYENE